jgi:hypothetical protein
VIRNTEEDLYHRQQVVIISLLILQSILNYKTYMSGIEIEEKLNLPENSTIKHENVRCRKDCKHNTHYYYHAYFEIAILRN